MIDFFLSLHDVFVAWLATGLLSWSWWQVLLLALVLTHITIAAVTIFLHRAQAHRALELHWLPAHFFRLWLWLTTGMVTKEWVAIHRKHHARCETEEDPHSPVIKGIKTVLFTGSELYRAEAKKQETLDQYGHNTPDDWLERNLYARYSWQGVGVMLIIDLLLFGALGVTVWAIQMLWIPVSAAGVINGIGHYWGYRNFEVVDASTNIVPWGIIIGGEELHNNHHTYPTSAKLSVKPWEFDIGWLYIRLMEMVGLARVKKIHPVLLIEKGKQEVDSVTVEAVIALRHQLVAHLDHLREKLRRDGDHWGRQEVAVLKERLTELWSPTNVQLKTEGFITVLKEWCREAQLTCIPELEKLARRLPSYRLKSR